MSNKNVVGKVMKFAGFVAGTVVVTAAAVAVFTVGTFYGVAATYAYRIKEAQGKPFKGCPIDRVPEACDLMNYCPLAKTCATYEKAKAQVLENEESSLKEENYAEDEFSCDEGRVSIPYECNL